MIEQAALCLCLRLPQTVPQDLEDLHIHFVSMSSTSLAAIQLTIQHDIQVRSPDCVYCHELFRNLGWGHMRQVLSRAAL